MLEFGSVSMCVVLVKLFLLMIVMNICIVFRFSLLCIIILLEVLKFVDFDGLFC